MKDTYFLRLEQIQQCWRCKSVCILQDDVLLPALQEYVSRIQQQTQQLEDELRECDDIMQQVEIGIIPL